MDIHLKFAKARSSCPPLIAVMKADQFRQGDHFAELPSVHRSLLVQYFQAGRSFWQAHPAPLSKDDLQLSVII